MNRFHYIQAISSKSSAYSIAGFNNAIRSFMWMLNNSGDSKQPWHSPTLTWNHLDKLPCFLTAHFYCLHNSLNCIQGSTTLFQTNNWKFWPKYVSDTVICFPEIYESCKYILAKFNSATNYVYQWVIVITTIPVLPDTHSVHLSIMLIAQFLETCI